MLRSVASRAGAGANRIEFTASSQALTRRQASFVPRVRLGFLAAALAAWCVGSLVCAWVLHVLANLNKILAARDYVPNKGSHAGILSHSRMDAAGRQPGCQWPPVPPNALTDCQKPYVPRSENLLVTRLADAWQTYLVFSAWGNKWACTLDLSMLGRKGRLS